MQETHIVTVLNRSEPFDVFERIYVIYEPFWNVRWILQFWLITSEHSAEQSGSQHASQARMSSDNSHSQLYSTSSAMGSTKKQSHTDMGPPHKSRGFMQLFESNDCGWHLMCYVQFPPTPFDTSQPIGEACHSSNMELACTNPQHEFQHELQHDFQHRAGHMDMGQNAPQT